MYVHDCNEDLTTVCNEAMIFFNVPHVMSVELDFPLLVRGR